MAGAKKIRRGMFEKFRNAQIWKKPRQNGERREEWNMGDDGENQIERGRARRPGRFSHAQHRKRRVQSGFRKNLERRRRNLEEIDESPGGRHETHRSRWSHQFSSDFKVRYPPPPLLPQC